MSGDVPVQRSRLSRSAKVVLLTVLLLAGVALLLWSQRSFRIKLDQVSGGALGVIQPGDFWSAETGPALWADGGAVARLWEKYRQADPVSDSSLLALVFCALQSQGKNLNQIVAEPDGTTLLLGVIISEGEPPPWWSSGSWMARKLSAVPQADWKMGVVTAEPAREKLRGLADRSDLGMGEIRALIRISSLHPGLLTNAQVEALLARWAGFFPEYRWALDPVLELRKAILETARAMGFSQTFSVNIGTDGLPAPHRIRARKAVEGLIRSAGFEPVSGNAVRLVLTSETRDFPGIVWDYATRTETRTTVRNPAETGPGRPWMTTVNKGETISRQTIPARLRSPVLLVDLTAGELRKRMEGAPFGFPRQEPSSGVPGLLLDGTSPSEVKRYQLPAETDLLLDAWSWGIP